MKFRACADAALTLVMAITGLALVGTAGAFGYRDIFGDSVLPNPQPNINLSNEPNTIAPASSQLQAKSSGNESQVGAETTGSIETVALCSATERTPTSAG